MPQPEARGIYRRAAVLQDFFDPSVRPAASRSVGRARSLFYESPLVAEHFRSADDQSVSYPVARGRSRSGIGAYHFIFGNFFFSKTDRHRSEIFVRSEPILVICIERKIIKS